MFPQIFTPKLGFVQNVCNPNVIIFLKVPFFLKMANFYPEALSKMIVSNKKRIPFFNVLYVMAAHSSIFEWPPEYFLLLLFKEINFRQNTANWGQPRRTHDLTQAPDLGSYARSIPITNITC